jgi:TrmH family RNA methyltransferase
VVAARKLLRRAGRDRAGRFLVEGAQAVREAVRYARVRELFVTAAAADRHPDLVAAVADAGGEHPSLVAVCAGITDPGNAGTVIRVADAAGADTVLLAGDTVDPHNGKAVRASTGSVFHLPLARDRDAGAVLDACRAAGLTLLVADAAGELDLHAPGSDPVLAGPVAWVFGGEAHGVPADLAARADHHVRIPIHGRAESLNLATAAAVCLYASAAARRR